MEGDLAKGIGHASAQHAALESALSTLSPTELGFTPDQAEALMAPLQLNVTVCLDDVTVWATHARELHRLGAVGANEPTPWVVSLVDLIVICDFLEDGQMAQYLLRRQRLERDGRVTAHDELDWLGNYIREGLHFEDILDARRTGEACSAHDLYRDVRSLVSLEGWGPKHSDVEAAACSSISATILPLQAWRI
jgi:hypothetical protein